MELNDVVRPGLMISNVEPESRKVCGGTFAVLEETMGVDFFEAYQTVEVPYADERRRIAEVVKAKNLSMTYCVARVLNENKLDLSSLDERLRRRSVEELLPHLDDAAEQGAGAVQVISGPAEAESEKRAEQLFQFEKSWLELCTAAKEKGLTVLVEPLDIGADKKKAIGKTNEVVEMAGRICADIDNARICLDTSHMILNGEDVISSVTAAMEYVDEFHFCNPVLDKGDPLYGDTHIRLGRPGELDVRAVGRLMVRCCEIGFFSTARRPRVFLEVRKRDESASDLIRYCRQSLLDGWATARFELEDFSA